MVDPTDIEYTPSPEHVASGDGPRNVALVVLGDSYANGFGDPKGQGWVTRVLGRTSHPDLVLTAYNLAVAGYTSHDVLSQWYDEVPRRWGAAGERRLVVAVGTNDILTGMSLARHRLNLANLLDQATTSGVGTLVVGPPPHDDESVNEAVAAFVAAQADVCGRRSVPFVDCFTPLHGHEQWRADVAASGAAPHPGQAGYGLLAWLVLHGGWGEWLQIT